MASSSSSSSPEISNAPAVPTRSSVQYSDLSRDEVLEDLSSRFILNLPEEELASLERVCFQVEQAHWYYEDFVREQNPSRFPSYTLKTFSEALFHACPLLHHWAHDHERTFQSFMQYKTRVPVCGAIMLNATWDKCILVKGWKSSAGWGFPKGKINEQEPRHKCAIREVLEETGYDLDGQLDPDNVIELSIKEQSISLYIVPGVPEDFPFQTRTRKEISKIAWFNLADLPTWRRSKAVPGKFYLITPFIGPLKAFINKRKPRNVARKARRVQNVHHGADISMSSEDELPHDALGPDNHAQESSSQSSSLDNGEPQTPSPLYSAAQVNYSEDHTQASTREIDINSVDPHFAKLLTGLSLSASGAPTDKASGGDALSLLGTLPQSGSETRKVHRRAADSGDWSLHMPAAAQASPVARPMISSARPPAPAYPASQRISSPVGPSNSGSLHPGPTSQSPPIGSLPSNSTIVQSTTPTRSPSLSPQLARPRKGSTATADISPYLARPRDTMKEMKYISMLEGLAQESDKLASKAGALQPIMRSANGPALDRFAGPVPPPSLPPQSNWAEPGLIYSSVPPASQYNPAARPLPFNPGPAADMYNGRPQTSAAFRPGVGPYPRPPPLGMSMGAPGPDAHHRPGNMGGYPPLRPSTAGLSHFQPPPPMGPYHGPLAHMHAPGMPPQGPPPGVLRVAPPEQFPARFGGPLSAPAVAPLPGLPLRANPARAANNAHLLSILNSPNPAPSAAAVRAQPAAFGAGPR